MTAAKTEPGAPGAEYRIQSGAWSRAWMIAAGVGVLGLAGAGAGYATDSRRFAFSWLFAFLFFLTMGLGSLIFVLIQHLTSAGWSITVRRTAEFFMAALPVFLLLFIPVFALKGELFPWMHREQFVQEFAQHAHEQPNGHFGGASEGEHTAAGEMTTPAEAHGTAAAAPMGHPEDAEQVAALGKKTWYLDLGFFLLRAVLYFAVWTFLSQRYFRLSTSQDRTKDIGNTVRAQRLAPFATVLFGLSITFAAFDWIMSLNPMWYSTIFGVWIFAGSMVTFLAVLTLVTLSFHRTKLTGDAINVEHFHDLGKLTFGFLVFWAYISFSQFFLTWYASIPEETVFYHHRWGEGPWRTVSLAIILLHFVLPFFLLLSRNTKRRLWALGIPCAIIVTMHLIEMYWAVLPNVGRNVFETDAETMLSVHWMDFACFLGVGGVYLSVVFWLMSRYPLIPLGDPRLPRALHFENA